MTRVLRLLRDLAWGTATMLALPIFVGLLVLTFALTLGQSDGDAPSYDDGVAAKRYAAALAAESAAVWRKQSRPLRTANLLVRSNDTTSMHVGTTVDAAVAAAQADGRLPQLTMPVVIVARVEGVLTQRERTEDGRWDYPLVFSRFIALPRTAGDACVASTRRRGDDSTVTEMQREQYLADAAPCLYVAAFGLPGARVRAWLDSTDWVPAAGPIVGERSTSRVEPAKGETRSAFAALRVFDVVDPWRPAARYEAADLLRCIAGDDNACAEDALAAARRQVVRDDTQRAAGLFTLPVFRHYKVLPEVKPDGELIDSDRRIFHDGLLAALLADLGPARFRRIWQSDLSIAESYRKETGEPFDAWARRYLGVPSRGASVPLGADVSPASLWWITASVMFSLGVVALGYRRAQLG